MKRRRAGGHREPGQRTRQRRVLGWVSRYELGKGPFRWQVYQGQGGRLLVTSEEFDLPTRKGQTVTVEVALLP